MHLLLLRFWKSSRNAVLRLLCRSQWILVGLLPRLLHVLEINAILSSCTIFLIIAVILRAFDLDEKKRENDSLREDFA